ncbi:hypothetical protein N0V88_007455 [Collariella sp. IMI 366227]|nr:hypothetical protein N0V88_007455 [Collariella sp. IMI 366227]
MNNRSSARVADGSDDPDYYVTLTVYHEIHCLVSFPWFLDPEYYANKTWEEQAQDKFAIGHYRHCLWSLLESVLCNGDTSMRTFHWDPKKPAPKPDSLAERKCVDWEWLDQHQSSAQVSRWTSCGSTPTEAKSRGCRFDILSFAWQTPECYDDELMQDFLRYSNWQLYAHPNRTDEVVDLAIALEGQKTLYVDWKYHITHCAFMWRQMHRAYALRGYIDSHLENYKHTLHCQWVLIEANVPLERVNVVAAVKYPQCRKIGGGDGWKPIWGGGSFEAEKTEHVH